METTFPKHFEVYWQLADNWFCFLFAASAPSTVFVTAMCNVAYTTTPLLTKLHFTLPSLSVPNQLMDGTAPDAKFSKMETQL